MHVSLFGAFLPLALLQALAQTPPGSPSECVLFAHPLVHCLLPENG